MMPDLKGVLQMSEDATLLKKLEETLVKIKNSENDRDVQNAIEAVIPVMEKVGVVLKRDKTVKELLHVIGILLLYFYCWDDKWDLLCHLGWPTRI